MDRDLAALIDIHRAGTLALRFVRDTQDAQALNADLKTRSAVLHQLLVLGEATKRLSPSFREAHAEIPWRQMAGLRDVLIHAYDAVDEAEVWRVLRHDLPTVLARIASFLPPHLKP